MIPRKYRFPRPAEGAFKVAGQEQGRFSGRVIGHGSHKASLFLPEVREETVIEEVPPGGPVVTGFTDTEVLIFDSVLV